MSASLLAIALEFEADLDAAVASGLSALGFEQTGGAMLAFIKAALGEIAGGSFVRSSFAIGEQMRSRAGEFIPCGIVGEMGR